MDSLYKRILVLSPEKRHLLQGLLAAHDLQMASPQPSFQKDETRGSLDPRSKESGFGDWEALTLSPAIGESESTSETKKRYRRVYNEISRQLDASPFGKHSVFCTLGYVPNGSPEYSQVRLPNYLLNKNMIKLVLEVIGDCSLTDCRVLDVGCGRGGTISVIAEHFAAKTIVGVDLSAGAIASCRQNHAYDHAAFLEGDAEELPFKDLSFDIITNVESSHSYPNLAAFYRQVFRVLRRGGCFLYTDVFPQDRWQDNECLLQEIGFAREHERDITANVLLSCDETATNKLEVYCVRNDGQFMNNFLGTPDSELYWLMKNGQWCYEIFRFRKN